MQFVISQLGARRHYAVPRILHRVGMLHRLYTDLCALRGWPRLMGLIPSQFQPGAIRRLLGRAPREIPRSKVRAFTGFGWQYGRQRSRAETASDVTANWLWGGRRFCELVLKAGLDGADAVYVFNSAGLEILECARQRGMFAVLDQTIAPRQVERELIAVERARFPGWEQDEDANPYLEEYCERERREWVEANVILCGSPFVRDSLARCGVPQDRCEVVPYGTDERFAPTLPRESAQPLRVLTVGAIGLRKGSPYVLEAAKQLKGRAEFRWVGPMRIEPHAEAEMRQHVVVVGSVPRSAMAAQYAWADVLLLPSICEGSAGTVYEAMASGRPVICTPNAGSVVRDGVDGFIVSAGDVGVVVERLTTIIEDPQLRCDMSMAAAVHATRYDLQHYGERLITAIALRSKASARIPTCMADDGATYSIRATAGL